ncbi:MAG: hypothetical protein V5A37_00900, partial [Halobacteriales archaeon]
MTLAAETREAVRSHPFLLAGLRAGVVNYAAAARFLDVDGDREAVASALRRFGGDLGDRTTAARDARVTMHRGAGIADGEDPLLSVGGAELVADAGDLTAVLADGDVGAPALVAAVERLLAREVAVRAAGVAGGTLL